MSKIDEMKRILNETEHSMMDPYRIGNAEEARIVEELRVLIALEEAKIKKAE